MTLPAPPSTLPEGWELTTLGQVVTLSNVKVDPSACPAAPYLSLEHIESGTTRILGHGVGTDVTSTKSVFKAGDVLYGKLRPYLNKVCIPDFNGICSTDIIVLQPTSAVDPRYLLRFLTRREVVDFAQHSSTGVELPRTSFEKLGNLPLPLPPLVEQKRIADTVEELLLRVETVRGRLARVPDTMDRFRQAILAEACSGRLAGEGTRSWEATTLGAIATVVTSGPRGWARYYAESGAVFIRSQDISADRLLLDSVAYVKPPAGAEGRRTRVQHGDLLITITGANVTKCAWVDQRLDEAYVSQHVALVRLKDPTLAPFLHLYLTSEAHGRQQLRKAIYGLGKPGLNLDNIRDVRVSIPSPSERDDIFHRVQAVSAFADSVDWRLGAASGLADRLQEAILTKALRGELVITEVELARQEARPYDSASELLRRIQLDPAAIPTKNSRAKTRTHMPRKPVSTEITSIEFKELLRATFGGRSFTRDELQQLIITKCNYDAAVAAFFHLLDSYYPSDAETDLKLVMEFDESRMIYLYRLAQEAAVS